MKKGICARHYKSFDFDTFLSAGFEEISTSFPEARCSSELCADEKNFEKALELAKDKGIKTLVLPSFIPDQTLLDINSEGIKIALENTDEKAEQLARKIDCLNEKLGEVRFFACLNTGHSILSGEEAEDAVIALGERITSVHINDNHRTGDYNLIAFRGRNGVHWKETMCALGQTGYQGTLFMDSCIGPENHFPNLLDRCLKMTLIVCEHLITLSEVAK